MQAFPDGLAFPFYPWVFHFLFKEDIVLLKPFSAKTDITWLLFLKNKCLCHPTQCCYQGSKTFQHLTPIWLWSQSPTTKTSIKVSLVRSLTCSLSLSLTPALLRLNRAAWVLRTKPANAESRCAKSSAGRDREQCKEVCGMASEDAGTRASRAPVSDNRVLTNSCPSSINTTEFSNHGDWTLESRWRG